MEIMEWFPWWFSMQKATRLGKPKILFPEMEITNAENTVTKRR